MIDPYHSGERAIQEMTGERDTALVNGRAVADSVRPGAVRFIEQQQMCVLGWAAPDGELWAGVVAGPQGFARAGEDRRTLSLRLEDAAGMLFDSPPLAAMGGGDAVAVLFIELSTRRRLRANGRTKMVSHRHLTIDIEQAYPNCPKYIQRRTLQASAPLAASQGIEEGTALSDELKAWIGRSDTFFVASAHPQGAVDASHRGGSPGFVRLCGEGLRIPDYPGNSMFNTFGNFVLNPRAGLAFIDFETNRQLKLTGDVRLDLQAGDNDADATGGTGRWWEFHPRRWIVTPLNMSFHWDFIDASPLNP